MSRRTLAVIIIAALTAGIIFAVTNTSVHCPECTLGNKAAVKPAPAKPSPAAMPATAKQENPAPEKTAEPGQPGPEDKPAPPAAEPPRKPAQPGVIALQHLRIDLKNRTISIDATVSTTTYALEYLLCSAEEKGYESLLSTKAKPREVHAALLMLGLMPGKPGVVADGAFVPARGASLTITLRWKDKDGIQREAGPAEWLTTSGKAKNIELPREWIFVGSDILPGGRYLADIETGIISVANVISSVIDVSFESTRDLEQRVFIPNKEAVPEAGTEVEMVIVPAEGAENAPHARAILEIDLGGNLLLDGAPVTHVKLSEWAKGYIKKHEKGQVVIRANGKNPIEDISQAKHVLTLAGVRDFSEQYSPANGAVMPRNEAQLKEMLALWEKRFENPGDFIVPAKEDAEWTLEQINKQLLPLEEQKDLWREYERQLRKIAEKYRDAEPNK